jgi:hypothetical protein
VYVIGVARKYISSHGKNHPRAKKYPFVYLMDDDWKVYTKRISFWQIPLFKALKCHRIKRYCSECGVKFRAIVRNKKGTVECPNCYQMLRIS